MSYAPLLSVVLGIGTYLFTESLGLSLLLGFGGYIVGDQIEKHYIETATPKQAIREYPEYA